MSRPDSARAGEKKSFFSLATAHLEPTLKDLTMPHSRTAAVEELAPTSTIQGRSKKIFGSKGSKPTSSPGIESSVLSNSYTPMDSFFSSRLKFLQASLVNVNSAP
ncbi:hypothetical protein AVEN_57500-1 [Araneus ventricosus]|uniref:Uncharacterized protein n=1 Tax=Araneus ventricosus TaxID=182803 RepID=A0A4Y2CWW4_ARAVE|nr:hypothetical protein AVEN_57500-1 [Araneus ventricosus]